MLGIKRIGFREIDLYAVESEGSWRISDRAPRDGVVRVWTARAGWHAIWGDVGEKDGKKLAGFSGFKTSQVVEIEEERPSESLRGSFLRGRVRVAL